jgi:hypothetical protein
LIVQFRPGFQARKADPRTHAVLRGKALSIPERMTERSFITRISGLRWPDDRHHGVECRLPKGGNHRRTPSTWELKDDKFTALTA